MGDAALQELQQKLLQHTSVLKSVAQQSRVVQTTQTRSQLTLKELGTIDSAVNCYESTGRAYLLRPKTELQQALKDTETACSRQLQELAEHKTKAAKDVQAVEKEIRELIEERPDLAARFLQ